MPTTSKTTAKKAVKPAPKKRVNKKTAAKASAPALTFADGSRGSYDGGGRSPNFRGHGKKLMPVMLNKAAAGPSDRDDDFIRDIRNLYGTKPFARLDTDAGIIGRAITLGRLRYVSGGTKTATHVHGRDAKFQLTANA